MKGKGGSNLREQFLSGERKAGKLWLKAFHNAILKLEGSTRFTGIWAGSGLLERNSKTLKEILKLLGGFFPLFSDSTAVTCCCDEDEYTTLALHWMHSYLLVTFLMHYTKRSTTDVIHNYSCNCKKENLQTQRNSVRFIWSLWIRWSRHMISAKDKRSLTQRCIKTS